MPVSDTIPGWKGIYPFVTGGAAASIATVCIQPIDMVKVRMQLGGGTTNPIAMAQQMIAKDGFFTLYRGLSAGILRQMTYGMSRLGIFQILEGKFKVDGKLPFERRVAASLCAGGIGALVGTPADAALARMQADTVLPAAERRGYKNAVDALMRMAREEGIKGFFSGATPTVARGLAINVGMLSSFDGYKDLVRPYVGDGTATTFVGGGLSGWTAATLSLPFDFIATRLRTQKKGPDGTMPYNGIVDCARKVIKAEGPLALYTGYPTFVLRIAPHILLTWVFLDQIKSLQFLK